MLFITTFCIDQLTPFTTLEKMPCISIHILKKYLHAGGHGSDSESTVLDHTSGHFDDNNIMLLCNCMLANAGGVYQDIIMILSQRKI